MSPGALGGRFARCPRMGLSHPWVASREGDARGPPRELPFRGLLTLYRGSSPGCGRGLWENTARAQLAKTAWSIGPRRSAMPRQSAGSGEGNPVERDCAGVGRSRSCRMSGAARGPRWDARVCFLDPKVEKVVLPAMPCSMRIRAPPRNAATFPTECHPAHMGQGRYSSCLVAP